MVITLFLMNIVTKHLRILLERDVQGHGGGGSIPFSLIADRCASTKLGWL